MDELYKEHLCNRAHLRMDTEKIFDESNIPQWGPAVSQIIKVSNVWFAYNDEYATPILYCPFCGVKLE